MKRNQKNFEKAITTMKQTVVETERCVNQMLKNEVDLPLPYLIDLYRMVKNGIAVDYGKYAIKGDQETGMDGAMQDHINAFDREVIQLFQSYQKVEATHPQYVKNLMVNATLLDHAQSYYDVATENLEMVFDRWPSSKFVEWKWLADGFYHIYPEETQENQSNSFIQPSLNDLCTSTQLLKTAEYLKVIRSHCGAANLIHQTVMDQNQVSYTKIKK